MSTCFAVCGAAGPSSATDRAYWLLGTHVRGSPPRRAGARIAEPGAAYSSRPRRPARFFVAAESEAGPKASFEPGAKVTFRDKWGDAVAGIVVFRSAAGVEVQPVESKDERTVWVDEASLEAWQPTGDKARDGDVLWAARKFAPGEFSEEERARALEQYEALKGGTLRDAVLLAAAGTLAAAAGGPAAALSYGVGGATGVAYLWAVARKAERVAEGKSALLPIPLLVAAPFAALLAAARAGGAEGADALASLAPALIGFAAHKLAIVARVAAGGRNDFD